eukprot:9876029-Karenia_brevis.AAC.1
MENGIDIDKLESRLPNSIQSPGFEHAYRFGDKKYIMMKGEMVPISTTSEQMHMVVTVAPQITISGYEDDPWILEGMAEEAEAISKEIAGYPWIIAGEEESDISPLKS